MKDGRLRIAFLLFLMIVLKDPMIGFRSVESIVARKDQSRS